MYNAKEWYQENKERLKEKRLKNLDKLKSKAKNYYQENKERLKEKQKQFYKNNKSKILENQKRNYQKNREKILIQYKNYYQENKERLKEKMNIYYKQNKKILREKERKKCFKKYYNDDKYKIKVLLRGRINLAIKKNIKNKFCKSLELIGCSIEELKKYLEQKFKEGMTWQNHGKWHIDHIIPVSKFNLLDIKEQKKCFHYTNLQPLWAEENLKKSDKI